MTSMGVIWGWAGVIPALAAVVLIVRLALDRRGDARAQRAIADVQQFRADQREQEIASVKDLEAERRHRRPNRDDRR